MRRCAFSLPSECVSYVEKIAEAVLLDSDNVCVILNLKAVTRLCQYVSHRFKALAEIEPDNPELCGTFTSPCHLFITPSFTHALHFGLQVSRQILMSRTQCLRVASRKARMMAFRLALTLVSTVLLLGAREPRQKIQRAVEVLQQTAPNQASLCQKALSDHPLTALHEAALETIRKTLLLTPQASDLDSDGIASVCASLRIACRCCVAAPEVLSELIDALVVVSNHSTRTRSTDASSSHRGVEPRLRVSIRRLVLSLMASPAQPQWRAQLEVLAAAAGLDHIPRPVLRSQSLILASLKPLSVSVIAAADANVRERANGINAFGSGVTTSLSHMPTAAQLTRLMSKKRKKIHLEDGAILSETDEDEDEIEATSTSQRQFVASMIAASSANAAADATLTSSNDSTSVPFRASALLNGLLDIMQIALDRIPSPQSLPSSIDGIAAGALASLWPSPAVTADQAQKMNLVTIKHIVSGQNARKDYPSAIQQLQAIIQSHAGDISQLESILKLLVQTTLAKELKADHNNLNLPVLGLLSQPLKDRALQEMSRLPAGVCLQILMQSREITRRDTTQLNMSSFCLMGLEATVQAILVAEGEKCTRSLNRLVSYLAKHSRVVPLSLFGEFINMIAGVNASKHTRVAALLGLHVLSSREFVLPAEVTASSSSENSIANFQKIASALLLQLAASGANEAARVDTCRLLCARSYKISPVLVALPGPSWLLSSNTPSDVANQLHEAEKAQQQTETESSSSTTTGRQVITAQDLELFAFALARASPEFSDTADTSFNEQDFEMDRIVNTLLRNKPFIHDIVMRCQGENFDISMTSPIINEEFARIGRATDPVGRIQLLLGITSARPGLAIALAKIVASPRTSNAVKETIIKFTQDLAIAPSLGLSHSVLPLLLRSANDRESADFIYSLMNAKLAINSPSPSSCPAALTAPPDNMDASQFATSVSALAQAAQDFATVHPTLSNIAPPLISLLSPADAMSRLSLLLRLPNPTVSLPPSLSFLTGHSHAPLAGADVLRAILKAGDVEETARAAAMSIPILVGSQPPPLPDGRPAPTPSRLVSHEDIWLVILQAMDNSKLPKLFAPLMFRGIQMYPGPIGRLLSSECLPRLMSRQVWTDPELWRGLKHTFRLMEPSLVFDTLRGLPENRVKEVVEVMRAQLTSTENKGGLEEVDKWLGNNGFKHLVLAKKEESEQKDAIMA